MAQIYRSAKGVQVDMGALAAQHERTRAVSNSPKPLNARGDIIDSRGNIVEPVAKRVSSNYQRAIAPRGENPDKNQAVPDTPGMFPEQYIDASQAPEFVPAEPTPDALTGYVDPFENHVPGQTTDYQVSPQIEEAITPVNSLADEIMAEYDADDAIIEQTRAAEKSTKKKK